MPPIRVRHVLTGFVLTVAQACGGTQLDSNGGAQRELDASAPIAADASVTLPAEGGRVRSEREDATLSDGGGASPHPADAAPAPGDAAAARCWFEPLGFWVRCAETWGSATSPGTLSSCSSQCLADPGCTSVFDYTWLDPALGCGLGEGSCTPSTGVSYAEDGAREYRKVCGTAPPPGALLELRDSPGIVVDPASGCRFESIGDFTSCENAATLADAQATGTTFQQCLDACQARTDCTAVQDFWDGADTHCVLHLSSCNAPVQNTSLSRTYRKVCSG